MPRRQRACTDDVNVVFDRGLRGLLRRLEERSDVDVEAEISKRSRNHLLAAIMTVLSHLGDEDARPAAFARKEGLGACAHGGHSS